MVYEGTLSSSSSSMKSDRERLAALQHDFSDEFSDELLGSESRSEATDGQRTGDAGDSSEWETDDEGAPAAEPADMQVAAHCCSHTWSSLA